MIFCEGCYGCIEPCGREEIMSTCAKHPKYKGKKPPTIKTMAVEGCTCLTLYLMLKNTPRVGVMPTKVIKDKTKYTRKKKHKGKDDGA
jgi:hypothetical protein